VTKSHKKGTLANALMHHFLKNKNKNHIHFVNRLDRETSGLVLVAKHKFIAFLLSEKVHARITRHYHAILDGVLPLKDGCIDLPISRIDGSIEREVSEKGKECKTNYKIEKEFLNKSLVRIRLNMTRTHQVRVHFAHFDAPILGDYIYNAEASSEDDLMLVADRIAFRHPITDEAIDKKISFPDFFQAYLDTYAR
jgi:23S rRNA pseudouridine1911/1915/1917 synthase